MRQRFKGTLLALTLTMLVLFLLSLFSACRKPTEDPEASVVKLRDKLIRFAKGNTNEIIGNTLSEESYILLYGYSEPSSLESLPLSKNLRAKLENIYPPRDLEVYVLAHVSGDDVVEHTEWLCEESNYHPLLTPTPFIIKGNPYKLTKKSSEHQVILELHN